MNVSTKHNRNSYAMHHENYPKFSVVREHSWQKGLMGILPESTGRPSEQQNSNFLPKESCAQAEEIRNRPGVFLASTAKALKRKFAATCSLSAFREVIFPKLSPKET